VAYSPGQAQWPVPRSVKSLKATNNPCEMRTYHSDVTERVCSSLLQLINRKLQHKRKKEKKNLERYDTMIPFHWES